MNAQTIYPTVAPYCPHHAYGPVYGQQQQAATAPPYAQTVTEMGACSFLFLCDATRGTGSQPAVPASRTIGPVQTVIFCGQAAQQAVQPQGTFGPVNCTIAGFCAEAAQAPVQPQAAHYFTVTPFCGMVPQPPAAPPAHYFTIWPVCGQTPYAAAQLQAAQQAANFTVTPFCGQAAHPGMQAQGPYGPTAAATAQGSAGVQPQGTLGPIQCNITVYSLCTPVCGQ